MVRLIFISLIFTFLLIEQAYSQSVWSELLHKTDADRIEQIFNDIAKNETKIETEQLIKYVKILNNYASTNLNRVNNNFKSKIVDQIVSTDSIALKENCGDTAWWIGKFKDINSILPLFLINKQIEKLTNGIDTLNIILPNSGKTLSVIVNNKAIKSYILSVGTNQLLSEQELRHLESDEINELIDGYRNDMNSINPTLTAEINTQNPLASNATIRENMNRKTDNTKTSSNATDYTHQYLPPSDLSKGVAYRIQIAAARNPLPDEVLNQIYTGGRQKINFKEDRWVKYYVAETPSIIKAQQIVREPEMPQDAFIMSYMNGKKNQNSS